MTETPASHLETAAKGIILVLAATVLSQLFWFLSKLYVATALSKQDFGLFTLAWTIFSIITAVATLGLPEGLLRFIPLKGAQGDPEGARAMSRAAMQITSGISLFLAVLLYLLSGPIAERVFYDKGLAYPLRAVSLLIPFMLVFKTVLYILRGYGFIYVKVLSDIGTPALYGLLVVASASLIPGITGVLGAFVISQMAVAVLVVAYGYSMLGRASLSPFGGRHRRELLSFSWVIMLVSIIDMMLAWTDSLILGRYVDATSVGIYGIGMSIAKLITMPYDTLWFIFFPIAAELCSGGKDAEFKRTYHVLMRWNFFLTLPIFFVCYFFPETTLSILFRDKFQDAATPLRILAIGFLSHAVLGISIISLVASGYMKTLLKISSAGAVFNIALSYTLVKYMGLGMKGAALATVSTFILIDTVYSIAFYRTRGIFPLTPSFVRPVLLLAVVGYFTKLLAGLMPMSALLLPVYFLVFLVLYFAGLLLIRSIEEEDVMLVRRISGRLNIPAGGLIRFLERFV